MSNTQVNNTYMYILYMYIHNSYTQVNNTYILYILYILYMYIHNSIGWVESVLLSYHVPAPHDGLYGPLLDGRRSLEPCTHTINTVTI